MKHLLLQFLFVTLSINLFSQNLVWSKQKKGTNCCSYSEGKAITIDTSGNVYTTGVFRSPLPNPIDFDPGPGTYTFSTPTNTSTSIYVSKLDKYGNLVWAKQFQGSHIDEESRSIVVDDSNNVYVTGWFSGAVDFDPGPGTFILTSSGFQDIFILKLKSTGDLFWVKKIDGGSNDYGSAIAIDKMANIYVTGIFFSTGADFDPGPGTYTISPTNFSSDAFVLKLNAFGNFIWVKHMGGNANDGGSAILLDDSCNVYSTGQFVTSGDFDPGPSMFLLTDPTFSTGEIYLSKLDSAGNFMFAKQIGGPALESTTSLFRDNSKNIYLTGAFSGVTDFDPGPGSFSLTSSGSDIFVTKLNSNGNFIWTKQLGGPGPDAGQAISVDVSGNVYTGGWFQSIPADFDPGSGTFTLSSIGSWDTFISKLDSLGNFVWAKAIGDANNDYLNGLTVDKRENVYCTGKFKGAVDFDPNPGVYTMTSTIFGEDAFILKLGLCPAPINTTSSANLTVCGNSTTLSASGTGTINWHASPTSTTILGTGATFVTPLLAPGSYTYFVESINSCTINPVRTAIQIIINALPSVSITSNNTLVCLGQSATLTASGASTYTWSTSSTTSVIVVTPTTTTTYSVIGKDANGCQNTFSITQNFSQCVNIEELGNQNFIYYYPNPFADYLILNSSILDPQGVISVYNNLGQVVSRTIGVSLENKINLSHLSTGVYFMEVKLDGKLISKKIVKQ